MKQNFKRTMALLLMTAMLSSLAVVLSACFIKPGKIPTGPNHTFDENNVCTSCGYFETGLEFILNVDDASYSVSGIGTFTGTDVVIPRANLDAKPVTGISYGAFSGCDDIITITIPDSVTSIGGRAFYGCTNLTSVTIPDSVTSIGEYAFYGCTNLTSVTIPDNVTDIGRETFSGCTNLTSITIPDNVTNIGYKAFSDCTSLTSIIIPDSVINIGESAFYGCKSLTSITIPDSVTSIGGSAFSNCSDLTSIIVSEGNSKYHSTSNCIIETESKRLIAGCSNSVIPSDGSVTSIGHGAFSGCSDLTSIIIPDNATSIGDWAFANCTRLTTITIPDSVTSIGERVFHYCRGLTKINYNGTIEQWSAMTKGSDWDSVTGNYTVYCSDGNIQK